MGIKTNHRQFELLQILRAYSAFLVVYEHLFGSYIELILKTTNSYSDFISKYIFHIFAIKDNGGGLGVVQFFLLSGFVITMVAMRETRSEFMIKRFFRIFPLLFLSLMIITALYWALYYLNLTEYIDIHSQSWPSLVSWNEFGLYSFFKNLFLINVNMNMVMWTLRIEIVFYIIIFLFLPFFKKSPMKFYSFVITLYIFGYMLSMLINNYFETYSLLYNKIYNELGYIKFLFLGSIFFSWYDKKIKTSHYAIFSAMLLILLFDNSLLRYIVLAYFLLILSIFFNEKIYAPKSLVYLGNISYSIYLNHQTICTILIGILVAKFGYSDNKFLIIFIVMLFLILTISHLSYHFVERPFQNFARKIIKRFNYVR